jgi:aminodeoxychorismate lyase
MEEVSRAFKYGDGLFETIRVSEERILYLEAHFMRLSQGLDLLQMQNSEQPFSIDIFKEILEDFLAQKSDVNLRIRITFFRQSGGLYTPIKHDFQYSLESTVLGSSIYQLNKSGLKIGICTLVRLSIDALSNLKTISALPYVLAGLEKKNKGWDDCLILNSNNKIAESIAANVFLVKGNKLYTPALSEGCVMGVMRLQVIRIAAQLGIKTQEVSLSFEDVEEAEEVFFTNAIRGIQWVEEVVGLDGKFTNTTAKLLLGKLCSELII